MADHLAMASQLAGQSLRFGWYFGIKMLSDRRASRYSKAPAVKVTRPTPDMRALLTDLGGLFVRDALAVRDGLYPPSEAASGSFADHLSRVGQMIDDLPRAASQRQKGHADGARNLAEAEGLPDYFTQDFHFQNGGYLTEESARLYDVQVDTLFMGAANVMRRAALKPIAQWMAGRDQRRAGLLDIACGTGRSLREYRLAFPALEMAGLDLSQAYLNEARAHLQGLRRVGLAKANAEAIPLDDASQDIVTSTFLFHELPPDVRRKVSREVARVLKPGGLFVFIDSLQIGDKPAWDGMLEAFPARFHEPFFRSYAVDDLDGMFSEADLAMESTQRAFLAKVMVRRRL